MASCFRPALEPVTLNRRPLGRLTTNEIVKAKTPPVLKVERPKVSWSLLKKMSIMSSSVVAPWKACLGKSNHDKCISPELSDIFRSLDYYRFPFPALPDPRRLASLLSKSGTSLEREYFRMIIDCWRRALLSLYDALKNEAIPYFYYMQPDLVILFQGTTGHMKASIAKATKSLITLLRNEGIDFEQLQELTDDEPAQAPIIPPSDDSDQENVDPRKIREAINARLNRARKSVATKRSVAATTLIVRGELAVHGLVDFLLNQRDGKSYVILPELIAPGPFLHGALSRSELSVVGPILGGEYQVNVSGIVLPNATKLIIEHIHDLCEGTTPFSLSSTLDERTEPFMPFHL